MHLKLREQPLRFSFLHQPSLARFFSFPQLPPQSSPSLFLSLPRSTSQEDQLFQRHLCSPLASILMLQKLNSTSTSLLPLIRFLVEPIQL
ncbi:unnamed protein product, partial [Brassica oleracea var. botrytis]